MLCACTPVISRQVGAKVCNLHIKGARKKRLEFNCSTNFEFLLMHYPTHKSHIHTVFVSSGASAINEGDIFIYSCSAQLISFEVDSISKEINCAEHEYMNMPPSLIALAPLLVFVLETIGML